MIKMRWIHVIGSDVIVYFQLCASIPYWGMIMSNPTMETKALPRLARSLPNSYWYSYNLLCVQSKSRHISKALDKTQTQKWNLNSLFQTWMAITKPAVIFFFASKSISMFHCDCIFFCRPVISIRVRWKIRIIKIPGNAVHFRSKVFW